MASTAKLLIAKNWVRALDATNESGGSQPHVFDTDDGQYMVKVRNNPQGARVLTNELVGGLALDYLGVKHPNPALVDLPQDLLDISPLAVFSGGNPLASGTAFGSKFVQSDPGGSVDNALLSNRSDIAGTLAFDTWVRGHDSRQYRVSAAKEEPGKYLFIPVDQGHFLGSPDWDVAKLDADRAVTVPPPIIALDTADVAPFINQLRAFDTDQALEVANVLPGDWLTAPERASLVNYLSERASLAADALEGAFTSGGGGP